MATGLDLPWCWKARVTTGNTTEYLARSASNTASGARAQPNLSPKRDQGIQTRRIVCVENITSRHYITSKDSGLHFQNANGEHATLTGAKPLSGLVWALPPSAPQPTAKQFPCRRNNVYGVAKAGGKGDPPGLAFLGVMQTARLCQSECNATNTCMSWTWHPNTAAMGKFRLNCFGRTTDYWDPRRQPGSGILSGQLRPQPSRAPHSENGWVADVSRCFLWVGLR